MFECLIKFCDRLVFLFVLECIVFYFFKLYCWVLVLSFFNKVFSVVNNIFYIFLGIKIKFFVFFFVIGIFVVSGIVKSKSYVVV